MNTSVAARHAGENYFGIVYGDDATLEIIPYDDSIAPYVNSLGVEVTFYEKSFILSIYYIFLYQSNKFNLT